jgi:ATP-dependent DNA helicase RecQ
MLRQLLYQLSLQHVIRYVPCDHATVIFLHHDRLRPKNVNLEPQRYELLRTASLGRMEKMMDYVSQTDVCRSAYLLEYFGQTESADCGTCDVCRAANQPKKVDLASEIHNYINVEKGGLYALEEFVSHFSSAYSSDAYITELRRLIDEGSIPPPQNS